MRAPLSLIVPVLLFALFACAAACGPQMTARPAAEPETAAPTAPIAPATPSATADNTATTQPASARVGAAAPANRTPDAGPSPLRAGVGGPGFGDRGDASAGSATGSATGNAASNAAPCTADTLKKQLRSIVDACRKSSRSICGDVTLHTASGDAGADNVSVDFNLGTSGNTMSFSRCVTRHIDSVKWECAAHGQKLHIDLGCRL